jgi:hypothetical protein
MAVLLPQAHLGLRLALGMLLVVLRTVMRIARSNTTLKLPPPSFNSNKDLGPDLYIIIQWVLLWELPLVWEELFNSSSRKLWRDCNNFHLVVHPFRRVIRCLEHLRWDKADSNLS